MSLDALQKVIDQLNRDPLIRRRAGIYTMVED